MPRKSNSAVTKRMRPVACEYSSFHNVAPHLFLLPLGVADGLAVSRRQFIEHVRIASFLNAIAEQPHRSTDNLRTAQAGLFFQFGNHVALVWLKPDRYRITLLILRFQWLRSRMNPYPRNICCWRCISRTERRISSDMLIPVALAASFKNLSSDSSNRTGLGFVFPAFRFITTTAYRVDENKSRNIVDYFYTRRYNV